MFKRFITLTLLTLSLNSFSQGDISGFEDDDLNIGGDIFTDFNEELEDAQMMEDERFYKYGRLFSFQMGLGMTGFTGNRGQLYNNDPPSFGMGVNYFMDFQTSFGLGLEYSKHHFFLGEPTNGSGSDPYGFVDINMLRFYFSWRYYIDTSNLGTALTYSNPYFIARLEYWYQTNKFVDRDEVGNNSGGGVGAGIGFGFDFPIKIRESYINTEFLWHRVNFFDKYTDDYAIVDGNEIVGGYPDLTGDVWSFMVSYVWSW